VKNRENEPPGRIESPSDTAEGRTQVVNIGKPEAAHAHIEDAFFEEGTWRASTAGRSSRATLSHCNERRPCLHTKGSSDQVPHIVVRAPMSNVPSAATARCRGTGQPVARDAVALLGRITGEPYRLVGRLPGLVLNIKWDSATTSRPLRLEAIEFSERLRAETQVSLPLANSHRRRRGLLPSRIPAHLRRANGQAPGQDRVVWPVHPTP
jgi:hypothetical protein